MGEKEIRDRLLNVNIQINNISDLINTKERYPEAISVLVDLLKEDFDCIYTKEGIVRALTVKEAKGIANKPLLEEYYKVDKQEYRSFSWAIGNAFEVIIQSEDVDPILEIVKDKNNGTSRRMFVMALAKIKSRKEDIENILIPLLEDDDITGHVLYTLGKLKSEKAREKIIPYLNHPKAYYRREAKGALKKIDKG